MVVLVDPVKPKMKASGYERLKLEHDHLRSNLAFNFDLRRLSPVLSPLIELFSKANINGGAHFSAPPEPFLTLNSTGTLQKRPSKSACVKLRSGRT